MLIGESDDGSCIMGARYRSESLRVRPTTDFKAREAYLQNASSRGERSHVMPRMNFLYDNETRSTSFWKRLKGQFWRYWVIWFVLGLKSLRNHCLVMGFRDWFRRWRKTVCFKFLYATFWVIYILVRWNQPLVKLHYVNYGEYFDFRHNFYS